MKYTKMAPLGAVSGEDSVLYCTLLYFTTVLYCTLLLYCLPHSMLHLHIKSRDNPWCGFSVAVDLDLVLGRTDVRTDVQTYRRTSDA